MHGFSTDAKPKAFDSVLFLYYWGSLIAIFKLLSLRKALWISFWTASTWKLLRLEVPSILIKHLVSQVSIFELQILSLVNTVTCWEPVQVICILLVVLIIILLTALISKAHLLQVHHVFNLLRSRLVMKFPIRLQVLGGALEFCVLSWVVAWKVTILVGAENLHLSSLCGHASIGWVLRILSTLNDILDVILWCRLAAILLCLELHCVGLAVHSGIVTF
jgi:hypothetical protein